MWKEEKSAERRKEKTKKIQKDEHTNVRQKEVAEHKEREAVKRYLLSVER
jgi:hypothetical protein